MALFCAVSSTALSVSCGGVGTAVATGRVELAPGYVALGEWMPDLLAVRVNGKSRVITVGANGSFAIPLPAGGDVRLTIGVIQFEGSVDIEDVKLDEVIELQVLFAPPEMPVTVVGRAAPDPVVPAE